MAEEEQRMEKELEYLEGRKKKNKGWNQGTSFLILDLPKNGITERHDENVGCHKRVWVAMQHGRLGKIDCHENIL